MKAIMSEKLRNILNHPQDARELQKQLSMSNISSQVEKSGISQKSVNVIRKPNPIIPKK
jgi:hypothetical protein